MRLLPLLLLLSCAPVQEVVVPEPAAEVVEAPPPAPRPAVVLIRYEGRVSDHGVNQFVAAMQAAAAQRPGTVVVEINTKGGVTAAGFRFQKAIEDSPVPVVCVVDGEALSAGFSVLQSCPRRLMTRRSVLMTHDAYYEALNGAVTRSRLRELLADLDSTALARNEHDCRRLKVQIPTCRKRMARGWYMAWQEALQVGAVDEVVGSVREVVDRHRKTPGP